MPDDTGLDPKDAAGSAAFGAARRIAIAQARQRAAAVGGRQRAPPQRPGGILLTAVVVIAVLVGTLAIMIYAQYGGLR